MKRLLKFLAVMFLLLALAGFWGNVQFMKKGEGMPTEPATRKSFIIGMFVPPTVLLFGSIVCGFLAARRNQT